MKWSKIFDFNVAQIMENLSKLISLCCGVSVFLKPVRACVSQALPTVLVSAFENS